MLFVARGMKIALQADDGFSKLLAAGLTFGFALQTFIIVGGVLRVIPLTGITLPFVSYGGSSVVANFVLLAGLLLVSNRANSQVNAQISRLALVALDPARALIVATTYWQAWAAGGLAAKQDNEIQRVAQFRIRRGLIYASDGKTLLAANRAVKRGGQTLYFRRYPTNGFASQTVGYSTQGRSRAGIERDQNAYLTASNANLGTIFDKLTDNLKGTTVTGNNLILNLRVGVQRIAETALAGQVRRGGHAQPEDGRGVRDGVVAELQPEQDQLGHGLREHPEVAERVSRLDVGAAEPRDAGAVPAGLDVQDGDRGGRARRRDVQSRLAVLRPGLLHRVRPEGTERRQPGGTRDLRARRLPAGVRALDQRGLLQHRHEARRREDHRQGEGLRLLLEAADRAAVVAASSRAASIDFQKGGLRLFDDPGQMDPGRLAFGQDKLLVTPLQMALVAAGGRERGHNHGAAPRQEGDGAGREQDPW